MQTSAPLGAINGAAIGGTGVQAGPPLRRGMKMFGGLMLALSAATPASSLFVIVRDVVGQAGTGALISMGLAALVAAAVAQVYAELASAFPLSGGEYAVTGRVLGPMAGFVVLALNLMNSLLAVAVFALGAAGCFGVPDGVAAQATAIAITIGAALLGVLEIRTNAWVTGLFVAVEIAALALVAALGVAHPVRGLGELLAHPVARSDAGLAPVPLATIGLSVAAALFAFDGYGAAIYFGEEMHEAPRRIGRSIVWALIITAAAEIIPMAAAFTGAPDLARFISAKDPFLGLVRDLGGQGLAGVMGWAVGLAMVNAAIATVLLTARQLYSTGRDGTWGGSMDRLLARVSKGRGSPWVATLVAGVLSAGLCLAPLDELILVTGAGTAFVYAALSVAVLIGRACGTTAHAPHRAPLGPWLPGAVLLVTAGVAASELTDLKEGWPGLALSGAVGAAAMLWFVLVLRRKAGGWPLTGPTDQR